MTQQEYEQKRRECWEVFQVSIRLTPQTTKQTFDYFFDRAYNLGKQEKDKETEEMLTIPRSVIIDRYHALTHPEDDYDSAQRRANIYLLQQLFGSKCLPDEGGKLPANCQQVKSEPQAPDYFRDPAKKADLSPKEADLLISRTLRDFDFIKVHKCMESLGWKWIRGEDRHIPSVGELYQEAEELLKSAVEKQCNIFSGGLQAYFDGDEVTLLFAVADSGYTLEELESEKKSITK